MLVGSHALWNIIQDLVKISLQIFIDTSAGKKIFSHFTTDWSTILVYIEGYGRFQFVYQTTSNDILYVSHVQLCFDHNGGQLSVIMSMLVWLFWEVVENRNIVLELSFKSFLSYLYRIHGFLQSCAHVH